MRHVFSTLTSVYTGRSRSLAKAFASEVQLRFIPLNQNRDMNHKPNGRNIWTYNNPWRMTNGWSVAFPFDGRYFSKGKSTGRIVDMHLRDCDLGIILAVHLNDRPMLGTFMTQLAITRTNGALPTWTSETGGVSDWSAKPALALNSLTQISFRRFLSLSRTTFLVSVLLSYVLFRSRRDDNFRLPRARCRFTSASCDAIGLYVIVTLIGFTCLSNLSNSLLISASFSANRHVQMTWRCMKLRKCDVWGWNSVSNLVSLFFYASISTPPFAGLRWWTKIIQTRVSESSYSSMLLFHLSIPWRLPSPGRFILSSNSRIDFLFSPDTFGCCPNVRLVPSSTIRGAVRMI